MKGGLSFFLYICAIFMLKKMRRITMMLLALCCCLISCDPQKNGKELIQRNFYNDTWERFDYVVKDVEIDKPTTFDLSMQISFTDDYPYDFIDLIFVVFTPEGDRYRAREYRHKLKDKEGHWNADGVDGVHTFVLPINKELQINDTGTYRFQLEQKMPITPVVGVKELTLINNAI